MGLAPGPPWLPAPSAGTYAEAGLACCTAPRRVALQVKQAGRLDELIGELAGMALAPEGPDWQRVKAPLERLLREVAAAAGAGPQQQAEAALGGSEGSAQGAGRR